MKLGIIGAGSIGLLCAAYLAQCFEVTLYTRTKEQSDKINQSGILLLKGAEQTSVNMVKAKPFSQWDPSDELTIVTVKQYQLPSVIEKINEQSISGNLLFLQNGMGHLRALESLRGKNVFVGTVEHGALKENLHTVRHNGAGVTNIAVFNGDAAVMNSFIDMVPGDFPVLPQKDYYEMLIKKLIVNAVINPLTAILRVKNGALVENAFYLQSVSLLFAEIASILNLDREEDRLEQVIQVCKTTADNRSSMLKDLEAGRLTEVDAILGYLLEEAKIQQKPSPLLASLYYFIKGKEQDGRAQ
jgi:2-dehydropantoate 2-reductase